MMGVDEDHLHMGMVIRPRYSISDVMGRMKSQSSSRMRKKFKWLRKVYWKENILWSPGYFVSSVGVDEETIKKYVEREKIENENQVATISGANMNVDRTRSIFEGTDAGAKTEAYLGVSSNG